MFFTSTSLPPAGCTAARVTHFLFQNTLFILVSNSLGPRLATSSPARSPVTSGLLRGLQFPKASLSSRTCPLCWQDLSLT